MSALPLHRIRLETDTLLRERAFFSRGVRGILEPLGYMDLLSQLASLVFGAARERSAATLQAAGRDLQELRRFVQEPLAPGPCEAVVLYQSLFADERMDLSLEVSLGVNVAVLGTSWCSDTAHGLSARYPHSTRLLSELGAQGGPSLQRVTRYLHLRPDHTQTVYALAELTRGALLGLATYLDTTWRAPSALIPLPSAPATAGGSS